MIRALLLCVDWQRLTGARDPGSNLNLVKIRADPSIFKKEFIS